MVSRTSVRRINEFAQNLFDGAAPGYDRIAALLSYGQYSRWHAFLVSRFSLHPGALVLDVATGTGAVAMAVVRRYRCRAIGLDLSHRMLEAARRRISSVGYRDRISLVQGQAEILPFPPSTFDAVFFTYLLRYVEDPKSMLQELARVLKPGGWMASLEFDLPGSIWYLPWKLHTRLVLPLAGWLISPGWHKVGKFLGPSIEQFVWKHREDIPRWWEEAGMVEVQSCRLSLGGAVVFWGRKAGA
jgi:demethylmenaquinone methyltransferase/2-methoxy-6-polyprenyl-1,4-benzoquinol methylase